LGPKKLRVGHLLERQNGAKCRENTQKRTKTSARKAEKYRQLSLRLKKENDALKDTDTMEEFERLALKCFSK